MKVVLIGTTAGCVIGFRADLIKSLVANGNEVYALALDYDATSSAKVFEMGAVPVNYTFSRGGLNPIVDILNTYHLSKKLKDINPDLVFSYFAKPVIFGTLAAVLANVKRRVGMLEGLGYVFTEHPGEVSRKIKILRHVQIFLYGLSFPFLERLIFLNPDDPVDLLEKNQLKVKQVSVLGGIGLDLKLYPYTPAQTSPISFLFVGRLLVEKGVNEYIAAAQMVKSKFPATRFILLGGVDEENPGSLSLVTIQNLVDKNIIIYPGYVENIKDWIVNSSVFVLPSYREGCPRSTQEAMAIGRAVITSDVPGCRETTIDGLNGFLIPPWSASALAEKMIYFIQKPHLIEKMGRQSHKLAQERFDVEKVNAKILQYFS